MSPAPGSRLRWVASLLVPLGFMHVVVFLRIPLDVYLASPAEHSSNAAAIFVPLALLGLASLCIVTAMTALAGIRTAADTRVWLIALALTLWVVDSFFGRSYPLLDGTVARIEPDRLRLVLEFVTLFAAIAILAHWQRQLEIAALVFLGLLALLNAATVLSALRGQQAKQTIDLSAHSTESAFRLSPERNVLVVLMDTFQSDFLEDVLAREPGLAGRLKGFVYFPDTLGVAPTTFLALPAIHSGRPYDAERSMSDYFDSAIRDASFLGQLSQSGYRAVLVNPILNLCPTGVSCASRDGLLHGRWRTGLLEALHLLDVSLMRAMPEPLKNWAFNGGQYRVSALYAAGQLVGEARTTWDDDRLLAIAAQNLHAAADRPTALFLHLMNSHPPYVLDADCSVVATTGRLHRQAAIQQVTCGLRRFVALLDRLHEQGIYDGSLIVLLSDHGFPSAEGAADLDSRRFVAADDHAIPDGRLVGAANPLLLIKPAGSRAPLRTDLRQASLVDVPATICALQGGGCVPDGGVDLFGPESAVARSREFLSYDWEHRFWELGYIPAVDFYRVTGALPDPDAWSLQPLGLLRQRIARISAADAGEVIAFDAGWSEPEVDSGHVSKRWVIGREARMILHLDPEPGRQIAYHIELEFYTPEFIGPQAVSLLFNGNPVSRHPLEHRLHVIGFRLPAQYARPGMNVVELLFERSVRPGAADQRSLATTLLSATLSGIERRATD